MDIEHELTEIWSDVLGIAAECIRPDANFFSLGGDSLLIARVMERVNARFFGEGSDDGLPITQFLAHGTIRALSQRLRTRIEPKAVGCEPSRPAVSERSIAIIGMAGRFPGAPDVATFWRNLCEGRETLQSFSEHEILESGRGDERLGHPRYVKRGALLENVQDFDAECFGVTAREASLLSPEQRLLIECSEEALQDAGYGVRGQEPTVGVFVGTGLSTYLLDHFPGGSAQLESTEGMAILSGNTSAATRISYLLDLCGPSITLDTACSSSLVAVHLACRALLNDECRMALAGGATVRRFSARGYYAEEGGIFSADGHCRPFDQAAQGTVGSSGAGIVLLKRLSAAVADGDPIHAVIRGTAINNDGRAKVGYTAPSEQGQKDVIRAALAASGVEPSDIQYVETHGTATPLGDLIEIGALREVFQSGKPRNDACVLGTLKANVGHLEAAAGVAGLIKVALSLRHRALPPAIHFRTANESLPLEGLFELNPELREWPVPACGVRRAGVSSFGIGGTNAHAILEEGPPTPSRISLRTTHLLPISGRSERGLTTFCGTMVDWLETHPATALADVAFTLQCGRRADRYRDFVVASRSREAADLLRARSGSHAAQSPDARRVVFMFPGQGSQYPQMAHGLYESEPIVRDCIDRCAGILRPHFQNDLREVLFADAGAVPENLGCLLEQTSVCQPALFAVEYAIAQLWLAWGIKPAVMIGHSLGEYVAACVSGLLTLEDALRIIVARSGLMQATAPGKMLAIRATPHDVARRLDADCSIAAINAPGSCVVSGSIVAIDRLKERLDSLKVPNTLLRTTRAFHSAQMDEVLTDFARVFDGVRWGEARIPFVSNLTGRPVDPVAVKSSDYWTAHLRNAVQFAAGVEHLMHEAPSIFLEIGPGTGLGSNVRAMPESARHIVVPSLRRESDAGPDIAVVLRALGVLWQQDVPVDWKAVNAGSSARRVSFPQPSFERKRYWVESRHRERAAAAGNVELRQPEKWFHVPVWKQKPRLQGAEARASGCCLILNGWADLERGLTDRLASQDVRVVSITSAANAEGLAAAMAALEADGLTPKWIVLADRQNDGDGRGVGGESGDAVIRIMQICRSLPLHAADGLSLTLIARAAYPITGDEAIQLSQSLLTGMYGVIGAEFPRIRCQCIDISLRTTPDSTAPEIPLSLVDDILRPSGDGLIAYRGARRWVRAFESLPLPSADSTALLRERGVYLVTGGLSGIGWTLARHLAARVHGKLVLVARTRFPDRGEWPDILQGLRGSEPHRQQIRQLLELERDGAEWLILQADVASRDDMRRVRQAVHDRFGCLDGVLHCAGVAGGGTILLRPDEKARAVLTAKVTGTHVVYETCESFQLRFFVCCSSLASIVMPVGQCDYSAANAYQDAFCHAHDGCTATRFISLNWDAWREVGMAVNVDAPEDARAERLRSLAWGISCEEGAQVFELALANPMPQWVVSVRGLGGLAPLQGPIGPSGRVWSLARDTMQASSLVRPNPGQAPRAGHVRPGNRLEQEVARIWKELLGIDETHPDADFFDAGGDSLLMVELRSRLESHFSRSVSLKGLMNRPTIVGMAEILSADA